VRPKTEKKVTGKKVTEKEKPGEAGL
jgi:hypothetical protein